MISDNDQKKLIRYWKQYSLMAVLACLRDLDEEENDKMEIADQEIERILYK